LTFSFLAVYFFRVIDTCGALIAGAKMPDGEEESLPTRRTPLTAPRITLAHKRYGLKCKYNPDAKYNIALINAFI